MRPCHSCGAADDEPCAPTCPEVADDPEDGLTSIDPDADPSL